MTDQSQLKKVEIPDKVLRAFVIEFPDAVFIPPFGLDLQGRDVYIRADVGGLQGGEVYSYLIFRHDSREAGVWEKYGVRKLIKWVSRVTYVSRSYHEGGVRFVSTKVDLLNVFEQIKLKFETEAYAEFL